MTKTLRVALRSRVVLGPRGKPLKTVSTCNACLSAATEPNTTVDASETPKVNASTGGPTAIS